MELLCFYKNDFMCSIFFQNMVQALSSTRNESYEVPPAEVTSGQIVEHNEPDGTLSEELLEELERSPALALEYEVDEIEEMDDYLGEEEEEIDDFWDDNRDDDAEVSEYHLLKKHICLASYIFDKSICSFCK